MNSNNCSSLSNGLGRSPAPQKLRTAWMLYLAEKLEQRVKTNSVSANTREHVYKTIGRMWKAEPGEVKQEYRMKADLARLAQHELNLNHIFRPSKRSDGRGSSDQEEIKPSTQDFRKARRRVPYPVPLSVQSSQHSLLISPCSVPQDASEGTNIASKPSLPPSIILRLPPGNSQTPTPLESRSLLPRSVSSLDLWQTSERQNAEPHIQTSAIDTLHAVACPDSSVVMEGIPADVLQLLEAWCQNYEQTMSQPSNTAETSSHGSLWAVDIPFDADFESLFLNNISSLDTASTTDQFPPLSADGAGAAFDCNDAVPLNWISGMEQPHDATDSRPGPSVNPELEDLMAELGIPIPSIGDIDFASLLNEVENDPLFAAV